MDMIVACTNIREELGHVMKEASCKTPVLWIDSVYHDLPAKLHDVLQQTLDSISNVDHVLLSFGFCGNALVGVTPKNYKLVFPRTDDCITLLLGSTERRKELEPRSYFFSEGWIRDGKSILTEYEDTIAQYGQKSADTIYEFMLNGYEHALLLDLGLGDVDELRQKTAAFSEKFHLKQEVVRGNLRLLHMLITGNWGDEFVVINPGDSVRQDHLFKTK